jgi:hypothetical protein
MMHGHEKSGGSGTMIRCTQILKNERASGSEGKSGDSLRQASSTEVELGATIPKD